MVLTTITDEVCENADLKQIFSLAREQGVTNFEIRSVGNKRFPDFDEDIICALKSSAKNDGVTFSAVSPGIFKTSFRDELFEYHKGPLLIKTLQLAQQLEIDKVIIFGIKRHPKDMPEDYARVLEEVGNVVRQAEAYGIEIMVENEPGFWADTSENCLRMLSDIDRHSFKLNWDPGNLFYACETDYKPGYERLKKYIRNVHVKDVKAAIHHTPYVAAGDGDIDFAGQVRDLKADGYHGCITIETHCNPLYENFVKSANYINKRISE